MVARVPVVLITLTWTPPLHYWNLDLDPDFDHVPSWQTWKARMTVRAVRRAARVQMVRGRLTWRTICIFCIFHNENVCLNRPFWPIYEFIERFQDLLGLWPLLVFGSIFHHTKDFLWWQSIWFEMFCGVNNPVKHFLAFAINIRD